MQKNDPRQYSGQQAGYPGGANVSVKPPKKKSGLLGRIVRRFFLLLFTVIFMVVGGLTLAMQHIFNGPSDEAKKVLTMTLLERHKMDPGPVYRPGGGGCHPDCR